MFQQDEPPPHWHRNVRRFLNKTLLQRWIPCPGPQDLALHLWPPRSPDLTFCDFFLWGYTKDMVSVPPLAIRLDELKSRITATMNPLDEDTLRGV